MEIPFMSFLKIRRETLNNILCCFYKKQYSATNKVFVENEK